MLLPRCGSFATAAQRCSASAEVPLARRPVRPTAQLRERRSGLLTKTSPWPSARPRAFSVAARSSAVAAAAASSSPPPSSSCPPQTVVLKVEGMVCSKCTDRVENALMAMAGVRDARADFGAGQVEVNLEAVEGAAGTSAAALAAAVEELGFGAVVA